ncbi:RNA polymerase sigma-H factor [Fusobacterium necrophorum subsp. funduliforme 1_1_36S]|nr:RNA polymerase sigma-H factor [Fusobacterium necrophorum subsp. funduliforme 1_1_36S]
MNLEQENIPEELIEKAKNGDQEAITFIIERYQNVISMSASHYYMVGAEKQDLLQEGMLGLLKALKAYDKERSSFRTFAILCIRRQLISAIKASNTKKNLVFHHAVIKKSSVGRGRINGKKVPMIRRNFIYPKRKFRNITNIFRKVSVLLRRKFFTI